MNNPVYNINNYSLLYPLNDQPILLKGELEIREKDTLLLSGNSGSGKTSLLYTLKGLIPETIWGKLGGTIYFRNRNIIDLSPLEKAQIGLLFQNPACQMVNRTVRQELAFGLENLGISPSDIWQKITYLAEEFAIINLLDRDVTRLSGGEMQKIALLSIMAMEPEVYLFDEPTAFLDPDSARHFIAVFQRIVQQKTVIVVEHNLNYLQDYINRIIQINEQHEIKELDTKLFSWHQSFPALPAVSPGESILKVRNLKFGYTDNPILFQGVDFELREGEIVGIVGANGSGKTTLLKILAGNIRKYIGNVLYKNTDIRLLKPKIYFQDISLLFQDPANHFLFSRVIQEVSGRSDLLRISGLTGFGERNPFTLSEGEKRRLSLAIQWAGNRQIYLLDEPTFGQDYASRLALIDLVGRLRQQGCSFIIAGHDYAFLAAVCTRILEFKQGTLQPREIRQ